MTLYRSASIKDLESDGRNLTVVAVPFDRPTLVRDSPEQDLYLESWAYQAFRRVKRDAARTELRLRHTATRLGRCTALREDEDYLVADFRLDDSDAADEAIEQIASGQMDGASIGADMHPAGTEERTDPDTGRTLVIRTRVLRLPEVSLTPAPAFKEARVLALREQVEAIQRMRDAERRYWGI